MKTTRSDFAQLAGAVAWKNVTGKPDDFGGVKDISQLTAGGFLAGQIPQWNGYQFVPGTLPTLVPTPGNSSIADLNSPAVATRRQPPGFPFGPTEDVWFQEVFDVRQYGAYGMQSSYDDTSAFNRAIADLNAAGRGVLYVPGGYYRGGNFTTITAPCSVIGGGVGSTFMDISGSGFTGGISGAWFEVAGLSMTSSGTGGTGVALSDGSNSGMFSFHDLDLRGFNTSIQVAGTQRRGFIFNSRLDPRVYGVNLTAKECIMSNLTMINDASTSALGMLLAGDYHQVHSVKLIAGSARWNQGILASSGLGGQIANSLFSGVVNEAVELSDGSSGTLGWRVQNITFYDVDGTEPVKYNRDKHYVNELHGIGASTNTNYDSRRELFGSGTWDPPTLRPLESCYEEFYLLGCKLGDQVALGSPYSLDFVQQSASVRANDIVRITLTNQSTASVNPATGTWKFRAFN